MLGKGLRLRWFFLMAGRRAQLWLLRQHEAVRRLLCVDPVRPGSVPCSFRGVALAGCDVDRAGRSGGALPWRAERGAMTSIGRMAGSPASASAGRWRDLAITSKRNLADSFGFGA